MNPDCAHVHDVAPELALGILIGAERGQALTHLAGCAECRQLVDELSGAADSLLLVAAEADPPLGFESRVMARLTADKPRRRPWAWIATAAAAAVLIAAATGITVHFRDARDGDLHLRTASLLTRVGKAQGDVYVSGGRPAWVFMSVDSPAPGSSYFCELTFTDGRTVRAGQFTVADREGWWGTAVKTGADDLRSVRLLSSDGTILATADFN